MSSHLFPIHQYLKQETSLRFVILKPEPAGELTLVRRQTLALVGGDVIGFEVCVDGVVFESAHHLLDGVRDEDEGDETGESLLGEARHVLDDVAGVRSHQDETLQAGVDADPQT